MPNKKKSYAAIDFEVYVGPSKVQFKKGEEVRLNPLALKKINPGWLKEEKQTPISTGKPKQSEKKDK